jgi:hypothetical protein
MTILGKFLLLLRSGYRLLTRYYRDAAVPVSEMMRGEGAMEKDPETGLYDFGKSASMEGIGERMLDFKLLLNLGGGNGSGGAAASAGAGPWGAGHHPVINFRLVSILCVFM